METTVIRRTLKFTTLDEAIRDADGLLASGYDKAGNWSLGQVCGHLTCWFLYPLDGFPRTPLLLRPLFWGFRNTLGPMLLKKALKSGTTKAGIPTVPESVMKPDSDDTEAVQRFHEAMTRWEQHDGPLHPSPLFGRRSKEEWSQMHRIHCAHHLGFLVPRVG